MEGREKLQGTRYCAFSPIFSNFGNFLLVLKLIFRYPRSPKQVLEVEFSHAEFYISKLKVAF